MNKTQEEKNNTISDADELFRKSENVTLINSYPTMKNDVIKFNAKKAEIDGYVIISQTDFTGFTANQKAAQLAMAKFVYPTICAPSKRYGRDIGDSNILKKFNYSEFRLGRYKISGVVQLVNGILDFSEILVDTVPAYVTSTEITSDNIEDGRALVVALNGCIGKSATAKDAVESALEKITVKQRDMWDIIFPNLLDDSQHFRTTNPDFVDAVAKVIKINKLPTQHTGISGYGTDVNGNVIIGGSITNLDLPLRPAMSFDNLGFYHDEIFKWGTHRYKFTHPLFKEQILTITIPRGRKVVRNVVMVAI